MSSNLIRLNKSTVLNGIVCVKEIIKRLKQVLLSRCFSIKFFMHFSEANERLVEQFVNNKVRQLLRIYNNLYIIY